MGRFGPGPFKKGVPHTNAGEGQKGGPKATFTSEHGKTNDPASYDAKSMGIKKEDGANGKKKFKGEGPGVPSQPDYDLSNRGKLDDPDSVGPHTRSDSQGLLNKPGSGRVKDHGQTSKTHKASEKTAGLPTSKVQHRIAEHLRRTPHQFRGE